MDIQQLGVHSLREKGYTQMWGIGRHILGSQIFDYDSKGFIAEHYTDVDVVLEEGQPVRHSMAGFQAWSDSSLRMMHMKVMQARGCWSNLNSNVYVAGEPAPRVLT